VGGVGKPVEAKSQGAVGRALGQIGEIDTVGCDPLLVHGPEGTSDGVLPSE
jgi:hypothetical protein